MDAAIVGSGVLAVAAVGVLLTSMELLSTPQILRPPSLLAVRVRGLGSEPLVSSSRAVEYLYLPLIVSFMLVVRLVAALAALSLFLAGHDNLLAAIPLAVAGLYVSGFKLVGGDGADQMQNIISIPIALAVVLGGRPRLVQTALLFIAAQAALAYLTAGIAKLVSPVWRRDNAVGAILGSVSYGHPRAWQFLRDKPQLGRAVTRATVVFEIALGVSLLLPDQCIVPLLALGVGFHVACAFTMGLNDFLWAFSATYPAMYYASRQF